MSYIPDGTIKSSSTYCFCTRCLVGSFSDCEYSPNSYIALNAFSHIEQFYECKILSLEITDEDKVDENGYAVRKGERFFVCIYLKKINEGKFYYQLQNMKVYVLPHQVLSFVEENNDLIISATNYQIMS